MDDDAVLSRIGDLVDEEHRLRERISSGGALADDERSRLDEIERQLDQCWDLLRQRRALRSSGGDPADAEVRPEGEVEGYLN